MFKHTFTPEFLQALHEEEERSSHHAGQMHRKVTSLEKELREQQKELESLMQTMVKLGQAESQGRQAEHMSWTSVRRELESVLEKAKEVFCLLSFRTLLGPYHLTFSLVVFV